MYLILALLFCALLVIALGIVLYVSLSGDRGQQPAQAPQAQQEAPAGNPGLRVNPSSVPGVRAPSVSSPSLSAPSVTAPSVSTSGISSGSVSAPSVSGPHVSAPSVSRPSMPSVPRASSGQLPAASAQTSQPAAESSGGTPYFALIIILSILLVIAVGAGVYFALRRS